MARRTGKRFGPPLEIHERLKAHINAQSRIKEAKRMRDGWASKGLVASKAGKIDQARTALKKAEWWDTQRAKWEAELKMLQK